MNSDNLCSKTATSNLIKHLKVCIYNFNTFSILKTFHYLLVFCRSTHFLICYTTTDNFAIHVKIMISGLKYVLVLVLDVPVLDCQKCKLLVLVLDPKYLKYLST